MDTEKAVSILNEASLGFLTLGVGPEADKFKEACRMGVQALLLLKNNERKIGEIVWKDNQNEHPL